jgi:DNA repair protein SbcD/Mre11
MEFSQFINQSKSLIKHQSKINSMKFSHIADCHIGGWREEKLNNLTIQSFEEAIKISINKQVDFILICGDLFNTALPSIDFLKRTIQALKKAKDNLIPIYFIAGSHDFSASKKTMLEIIEHAGLGINVNKQEETEDQINLKFTTDLKTGTKLTGLIGKKGQLEKTDYEKLNRTALEQEPGFKIFMFHTSITELKPSDLEKMESFSATLLPRNFNYYAGGHIHIVKNLNLESHKNLIYPGPTFPNSFSELEKLQEGSFYIYQDGELELQKIKLKEYKSINIDCNNNSPQEVLQKLNEQTQDIEDKIVTIRLHGKLRTGTKKDLDLNNHLKTLNSYITLTNTNKLTSEKYEEKNIEIKNPEEVEATLIKQHLQQVNLELNPENEEKLTKALIESFNIEKQEGETKTTFEQRLIQEVNKIMDGIRDQKVESQPQYSEPAAQSLLDF